MSCIFCKIIRREIPGKIIYESDNVLAFPDINAQAPVHFLIVPKKHYSQLGEIPEAELDVLREMLSAARQLAAEQGIQERGYRLAMNVNPEGGQSVFHVHLHLLGGTPMGPSLTG
ncbi:MAG TPA: histidine triad nucleotide-binding protein [Deltaproteobacteria bacterium]|nr:histidine triad nucleotide-binding protein [Deltaproteobacteria bacterium]